MWDENVFMDAKRFFNEIKCSQTSEKSTVKTIKNKYKSWEFLNQNLHCRFYIINYLSSYWKCMKARFFYEDLSIAKQISERTSISESQTNPKLDKNTNSNINSQCLGLKSSSLNDCIKIQDQDSVIILSSQITFSPSYVI